MNLSKGNTYEWNEILDGLNSVAGPVFYLLHRLGTEVVTAACVDITTNPRAPYEIAAGNGPQIMLWADRLARQRTSIHVFVKELDGERYYRGVFKVIGSSTDANEIALRSQQAGRDDIYRIIFLAETAE